VTGAGEDATVTDAPSPAGGWFVVLRRDPDGRWTVLGEVARRPGLRARAARNVAIQEASGQGAAPGDVFAAVLRSEWRVAQDW
jgi:hypothetical protein